MFGVMLMQNIENEIRDYIDNKILSLVQADGGEIKFHSYKDKEITVLLQGECSRCKISQSCFSDWLLKDLRSKFGEEIKLSSIIKKPYFWDK
jgi:Fe-S cluster biogenesis protein NfuA